MDWITGIQRAIDYIEDHLLEPLDHQQIAKQAYVSAYHFQRVFHILSGCTVGEYIRNRRLTLAAADLRKSTGDEKVKIVDVALKYGYDSPESFSRAFERFHGVLPSMSREMGANLKSFSRLSIKVILEGGSVMDYRIEEKGAFKLLAKVETVFLNNVIIPQFWDSCAEDGTIDDLRSLSTSEHKLMIGLADGSSYNGESYQYYIGTPFDGETAPEGYVTFEIPSRIWAIFRCVDLSDQSVNAEMFKKIFSEFFPASDYKPKEYQLEVFPDDGLAYKDIVSEVWVAVEKK